MGVWESKMGEEVVRHWPPTNLFLPMGVLTSWWKSIKKCDHDSVHRWIRSWQVQNGFIICSMPWDRRQLPPLVLCIMA